MMLMGCLEGVVVGQDHLLLQHSSSSTSSQIREFFSRLLLLLPVARVGSEYDAITWQPWPLLLLLLLLAAAAAATVLLLGLIRHANIIVDHL